MLRISSVLFMLFVFPALSFASPSISFQELQHDFGTISAQEKAEHVFRFTNTGDAELVIEKLAAS